MKQLELFSKKLGPWEKRFVRFLPRKFRPLFIFGLALLFAGLASYSFFAFWEALWAAFDWFGEGASALASLQRNFPGWIVNVLITQKVAILYALVLSIVFIVGYFWGMRLLFLEQDLPENCVKEARKTMNENPDFSDLLSSLIQQAIFEDDGDKLQSASFVIRQLKWNRKMIKFKQKEIEELKKEIVQNEKELGLEGK